MDANSHPNQLTAKSPRGRADPYPRSGKEGKSDQTSGATINPRTESVRYQRTGANSPDRSSSEKLSLHVPPCVTFSRDAASN